MQISVKSIEELTNVAKQILQLAGKEKIFLFYGEMGAGKTTLINKICEILGVQDHTSSPTFSIINEYIATDGPVYHFDFYRLKNQSEAFDLGYEDYFYSGDYCFIEWPEKISDLLPYHYIQIKIYPINETERLIDIQTIN